VPFIGGEPRDREIYAELREKCFWAKEIMGFELLRFIPIWSRCS
jgi:hypothetical protein